jgi:sugar/nucleoside kinase (ribokinase family)
VRVPVVKLGARGALLMADGKVHRQPALPVPVVDATGAGDAFNGGFLHAFLRGAAWDDCLRAGNICGSLAASQPGGLQGLPGPEEYNRWMVAARKSGLGAKGIRPHAIPAKGRSVKKRPSSLLSS